MFVNSEIFPYMPESKISWWAGICPKALRRRKTDSLIHAALWMHQRKGNQLHEVIRLSGMNIVVNKVDRPLVIKVSSISSARMQVYS